MTRLSAEDWIEAGLQVLREDGAAALTIDHLTRRLGVTKGSFYHHFPSRDRYVRSLLGHWERTLTLELIAASRAGLDVAERERLLTRMAAELFEPALETAIRAWALRDPLVMEFQQRVDEERIAYLEELFRLRAGDGALARDLALIRYAFSVGAQQLRPGLDPTEYSRLFARLQERLVALAEQHATRNGDNG